MDADVRRVRTIGDPVKRALQAADYIAKYKEVAEEFAVIRREAILELIAQGVPKQEIALLLGISNGRITQIINPKRKPKPGNEA